jgi:hypothetical protein
MAQFGGNPPYVEQSANVALALQLALVQDNAGVVTIAPARSAGWNASGSVAITGNGKVDVQVENGAPVTVAIEAGSDQVIRVKVSVNTAWVSSTPPTWRLRARSRPSSR